MFFLLEKSGFEKNGFVVFKLLMKSDPISYYDNLSEKLVHDFLFQNPRVESAIRFACSQLRGRNAKRVLDLGFGLGWSSFEYARLLSDEAKIMGLDLSPKLTEIAISLFARREPRLDYLCQDLCDPTWIKECEQQDACVMLDVYEHISKNSRPGFHRALAQILGRDAVVILTYPSTLHQAHLRQFHPQGLQPIDEDVTFDDLQALAADVGGVVTHFSYQNIWNTNDYCYAVITKGSLLFEPVKSEPLHTLITRRERENLLRSSVDVFDRSFIDEIIKSHRSSSFFGKIARRIAALLLTKQASRS